MTDNTAEIAVSDLTMEELDEIDDFIQERRSCYADVLLSDNALDLLLSMARRTAQAEQKAAESEHRVEVFKSLSSDFDALNGNLRELDRLAIDAAHKAVGEWRERAEAAEKERDYLIAEISVHFATLNNDVEAWRQAQDKAGRLWRLFPANDAKVRCSNAADALAVIMEDRADCLTERDKGIVERDALRDEIKRLTVCTCAKKLGGGIVSVYKGCPVHGEG